MRGLLVLLVLVGCAAPPTPTERLVFVRDGVIAPAGAGGQVLADGRELVSTPWEPGASTTLGARTDPAPARPECVPLFSVDLGDVSSLIARGAEAPNTALAFSPDGSRLAVGTHTGAVLVLDGWTGAVKARRSLAETMVKQVAWSADGQTLYAGEASPDAFLHALEVGDLSTRWSVRLADDVGSSPAPPATDIYGVYTLPAAYALRVLPGGDLLVAGVHAWPGADGQMQNKSRLLRVGANGTRKAAWPKSEAADAVLRHIAVAGDLIAVPVDRSAAGPAPDLPIGEVLVLDLATLTPITSFATEPIRPHFTSARIWEALDVDAERRQVLAGFNDGRASLMPVDGSPRVEVSLGAPILSGDVPIAAGISWGRFVPGGFATTTGDTNIPWGSQTTATRPPAAHPGERTVWVHDLAGEPVWTWRGEPALQGLSMSPDGRRLVVGAGVRPTDERRDLFGALVFRLDGGGAGRDRLEVTCSTPSPVFFRHTVIDDGRVAVSEVPWKLDDGTVAGAYRVTVLR
jgi:hypothetical protein